MEKEMSDDKYRKYKIMFSSGKKRKSVLKYQTCESALTNNQTE